MEELDYIINIEDDKEKAYQVRDYKKINYTANQCRFLIDILFQFRFAFYLPDRSAFILPELLSTLEPMEYTQELRRNTKEKVKFAYIYEYLPRSVLPAIMVELNSKMTHYWRTGLMIEYDSCIALITTYENKLKIEVNGEFKKKRILLGAIRMMVDNVNSKLAISPERVVPEIIDDFEFLINYEKILESEINHDKKIIEYTPFRAEFSVTELLEGFSNKDITSDAITDKLNEILENQKHQEELLNQQLNYLFENKKSGIDKNELEKIITALNEYQTQVIITEVENYLIETFPIVNEDLTERIKELYCL